MKLVWLIEMVLIAIELSLQGGQPGQGGAPPSGQPGGDDKGGAPVGYPYGYNNYGDGANGNGRQNDSKH